MPAPVARFHHDRAERHGDRPWAAGKLDASARWSAGAVPGMRGCRGRAARGGAGGPGGDRAAPARTAARRQGAPRDPAARSECRMPA
jgi:hypothetical protein